MTRYHVGVLATHPIQYYAPWYRALATYCDLEVFFSHEQSAAAQASAGYGVTFDWDVPMFDGYRHRFLRNTARRPDVNRFHGCVTPEITDIIRDGRFDAFIVHGWSTRSYWQAMRASWQCRVPLFVRGDSTLTTPRSRLRRVLKEPLYRWFIPRFDGYLIVGHRALEYLLHYGADPRACFHSPHCVDNARLAADAEPLRSSRAALRTGWGLPQGGTVFAWAGRFVDRKEPLLFVVAMAELARLRGDVSGLMAGDGPLRADAERLARQLGAPVRFTGFLNQSRIAEAYVAADVFVLPSTWETWGLVVNEAMVCGLPVIASEGVACVGDLVVPAETGAVFPVGDLKRLVESMHGLANDPEERRRLGENARVRVAEFSPVVAAAGVVAAIQQVRSQAEPGANSEGWQPSETRG
jgi:glycosyltransferase involved in cell wall biosynthesis